MDSNMETNRLHNKCIQTNADTNEHILVFDMSAIKTTVPSNPIECEDKSSADVKAESCVQMNGPKDEAIVVPNAESNDQMSGLPIIGCNLTLSGEPIAESDLMVTTNAEHESIDKSSTKYIRKTSTETLSKIWQIIDSNEWHNSSDEVNKSLIQKMFNLFNIKLNDNRMKQMIETALNDKLIIIEEVDNKIRYSLNFDPKLFGQLANDWFCFECHSVREFEDPIGCKKCFKSFHLQCLKGEHKVQNLKEESFQCLYCRRLREPDLNVKVDGLSKSEINKCISFVINNLQLSYDPPAFDVFAIEDLERNRVLAFKAMDVMSIRHKSLTDQYKKLEEAINDFKHFYHNFSVCKRDQLVSLKDLERRFNHEIKELKLCVDCYKYSSDITYDTEDDPHDWFTLVCDPPHELVFAKYGKYPFWPAKVIDIKAGGKQYDVRFFDAPDFSRAIVPPQRLRAIEGFQFEDEDNELELPVKLMEKHIKKMREKSVYFMPTIVKQPKRLAKKRTNNDPFGTERPNKRSKKMADN